jgi:predicted RNase H-like nuclease
MIVTGVDACKGGWTAVTLDATGAREQERARVRVRVGRTLGDLDLVGVTGIDMPLGLLGDGWRTADALARRALGARGVTVFAIPPRPVWDCVNYAAANATCRKLTGRGMSAQAWGLRARLLEADAFRADTFQADRVPLYEVHPELAFAALAGAPLAASKHSADGLAARRSLLAGAGIALQAGRVAGAAEDDVLDAAAVAWSAARIASGTAVVLTDPSQRADDGGEIAIRY